MLELEVVDQRFRHRLLHLAALGGHDPLVSLLAIGPVGISRRHCLMILALS